jgi:hypothetical protein
VLLWQVQAKPLVRRDEQEKRLAKRSNTLQAKMVKALERHHGVIQGTAAIPQVQLQLRQALERRVRSAPALEMLPNDFRRR